MQPANSAAAVNSSDEVRMAAGAGQPEEAEECVAAVAGVTGNENRVCRNRQ